MRFFTKIIVVLFFAISVLMPKAALAKSKKAHAIRECSLAKVGGCISMDVTNKGVSLDASGKFGAYFDCLRSTVQDAIKAHGGAATKEEQEFLDSLNKAANNIGGIFEISADGKLKVRSDDEFLSAMFDGSANGRWNDIVLSAKTGQEITFLDGSTIAAYTGKSHVELTKWGFIGIAKIESTQGVRLTDQNGKIMFRAGAGSEFNVIGEDPKSYMILSPTTNKNGSSANLLGVAFIQKDGVNIRRTIEKHLDGK